MTRKRLLALLLLLGASAASLVWWWPVAEPAGELVRQTAAAPAAERDVVPDKNSAALPPRTALGDSRGDAFAPRQWTPEPAAVSAAQPAPAPAPPPMPYRYAGKVVREGAEEILLAKGDALLPVRVGENLEGGYRVESIGAEWIVLRHVASGAQQRIVVNSALEPETQR